MMNCASENTILQSDEEQATMVGFRDRGSRDPFEEPKSPLQQPPPRAMFCRCFQGWRWQLLVSLYSVFDDRNHNVKKDSIAGQWWRSPQKTNFGETRSFWNPKSNGQSWWWHSRSSRRSYSHCSHSGCLYWNPRWRNRVGLLLLLSALLYSHLKGQE